MAPPSPPDVREDLSRALVDHGDRLYALALRVTRDPDLAADALQEAFATALERAADFRGESSLGTWLHRIVYNKAIDLLRKRGFAWVGAPRSGGGFELTIQRAGGVSPSG